MSKTSIEWCDDVWNPVTGCSHVSQGCKFCYAEREFPRLAANPKTPAYHGRAFTDVACHPERLDEPLKRKKPTRYFVNSMSDLFHEAVPFEFITDVWASMGRARQHTFIVLTKRPERALEFFNWIWNGESSPARSRYQNHSFPLWPLPNVWLGVSVEDQATADERIPTLFHCPAAVHWVSYEPALGPLYLKKYLMGGYYLDWIVAGGESGPNARPSHPDWFRKVRDDCIAAGVAYFQKQMHKKGPIPDDLMVREFPEVG